MEKQDDYLLDKIYECITTNKITCKEDLKLFGITAPDLQKEILWAVFEEQILSTRDSTQKHKLIQSFHRANLL